MREIQATGDDCGRAEGLIGYLYGEATADERAGFERHLAACANCRDELTAFRQVRTSVGEWRAELLQNAPALSLSEVTGQTTPAPAVIGHATHAPARRATPPRQRSARAALREFFALSPAWLRASSAAAALLLCALAALAVFNSRPTTSVATSGGDGQPAPASRLDELTAERDAARRELEETRAQLEDSRASNIEDALYEEAAVTTAPAASQESARTRRVSPPARRGAAGRSGARTSRDDDDLPRLLDLLGDAN